MEASQLNSLVELSDNLEEIKIIIAIGPHVQKQTKTLGIFLLLKIMDC
jgi:hypothetical protein